MATKAQDNRILERFRAALEEMYGRRLERVVLFGSRARGDAWPDPDYDVAVFLNAVPDRWAAEKLWPKPRPCSAYGLATPLAARPILRASMPRRRSSWRARIYGDS
jgi:Nucleotidyltransferase domain